MAKVDIGSAIAASFSFLPTAWARAWGILALNVVLIAAIQALGGVWPSWAGIAINLVAFVTLNAAASGALYRTLLQSRHPGDAAFKAHSGGLHWGGVETRTLLAGLIVGALFTVLGAIVAAACAGVFAATGRAADPTWAQDFKDTNDLLEKVFALGYLFFGPAGLALTGVLSISLVGLFWLGARLMLYALCAADIGSFSFGRAWAASRGATAAIWIAWIVISVAISAASLAVTSAVDAVAGLNPAGGLWGSIGGQIVGSATTTPLFVGLQLYVYQRPDA